MSEICKDPVPGACPARRVHIPWDEFWYVNGTQPLAVQLVLTLLFQLILHPAYLEAYYSRRSRFQRFLKTYVGTSENPRVARPLFLVLLYTLQTLTSMTAVVIWVWHTYKRETTPASSAALLALTYMDLLGWTAGRLGASCEVSGLWELNAVLDVLTGVPVLLRAWAPQALPPGYQAWLSLHFARSYSALHFFERARRIAQLDEHTAGMAQVMIQSVLRIMALLTLMAGTIFTFEVLGDPGWMQDSFVETPGGDRVSFLQMTYWITVTITTVGYGDYAPTTVVARVLTTGFIVIGVGAIYFIQYSFAEMRKQQHEGTGRYWQRSWGRERHVVVVLCHHGSASRMASLVHGFLQELLHASHNQTEDQRNNTSSFWNHVNLWLKGVPPSQLQTWPDVVILSPTRWEEERRGTSFRDFLSANFPSKMQRRVWFLVGKITSESDLERTRVRDSALTYVLSDLKSHSPEESDGQTVYSALCIRDLFPEVRLRLMVMKPEAKELAVQAGIDPTRIFSSHELSASLLAQNTRCRGLIPAVMAMLKSSNVDDQEYFLRHTVHQQFRYVRSGSTGHLPKAEDKGMQKPTQNATSMLMQCRSLDELEKVLRNSQSKWCPEKQEYERRDPWMFEYFAGAEKTLFGFDLHTRFEGLSFGELCLAVYRETGALVLGVQTRGRFVLCPQSRRWRTKPRQICFALSRTAAGLDACRFDVDDRTSWRNRFQTARKKRRQTAHSEGKHVSAAKLMGPRLWRSLLEPDSPAPAPTSARSLWSASRTWREDFHHESVKKPQSPPRPGVMKLPTLRESLNLNSGDSSDEEDTLKGPMRVLPPMSMTSMRRRTSPPSPRKIEPTFTQNTDSAQPARTLRQNLSSTDELIVVIVCHGDTWQQVRTFVSTMRQHHLPCLQPIIILAPTVPPVGLLEGCDARVVCMQGSSLNAQVLFEAGVLEAAAVVVFAGELSSYGRNYDFRTMLTAQELECWLGPSPREVFTTYELHDSRSARHLPRLQAKFVDPDPNSLRNLILRYAKQGMERQTSVGSVAKANSMEVLGACMTKVNSIEQQVPPPVADTEEGDDGDAPTWFVDRGNRRTTSMMSMASVMTVRAGGKEADDWDGGEEEEESDDDDETLGAGIEDSGHHRHSFWTWLRQAGSGNVPLEKTLDSIMYHQRFAAGQIFTPELWGMMLGRMFYMPAVIELMEALVMGSRRQQNVYPWQARVPQKYVGRPFEELLIDLTFGVMQRKDEDECDTSQPCAPPTVPLALYRLCEDVRGGVTSPFSSPAGRSSIRSTQRINPRDLAAAAAAATSASRSTPGNGFEGVVPDSRGWGCSSSGTSRFKAEGTGGQHYVVMAPPPDLILRSGDYVLCLGGERFGHRMFERGLLRGGKANVPERVHL